MACCRRPSRQRHGHHAFGHLRTQWRDAKWPRLIAPKPRRAVVPEPLRSCGTRYAPVSRATRSRSWSLCMRFNGPWALRMWRLFWLRSRQVWSSATSPASARKSGLPLRATIVTTVFRRGDFAIGWKMSDPNWRRPARSSSGQASTLKNLEGIRLRGSRRSANSSSD